MTAQLWAPASCHVLFWCCCISQSCGEQPRGCCLEVEAACPPSSPALSHDSFSSAAFHPCFYFHCDNPGPWSSNRRSRCCISQYLLANRQGLIFWGDVYPLQSCSIM